MSHLFCETLQRSILSEEDSVNAKKNKTKQNLRITFKLNLQL